VSIIHNITQLNGPVTFYYVITDWKRKLPRKMYALQKIGAADRDQWVI